jgi:curved DNA-binding protein CbpA
MRDKDYYQILRIDKDATPEEITKAFRALARRFHPDITTEDPIWAEEMFKSISEAYSVLGNPEKRAMYDQLHGFDVYRARKRRRGPSISWWDDESFHFQDDPNVRGVRSPFSFVREVHSEEYDPVDDFLDDYGFRVVHPNPFRKTSLRWRIKQKFKAFLSYFSFSKKEKAQAAGSGSKEYVEKEPHKVKMKKKE